MVASNGISWRTFYVIFEGIWFLVKSLIGQLAKRYINASSLVTMEITMQEIKLLDVFRNGKIQFREDVSSLKALIRDDDIVFNFSEIEFISFSACDEFLKLLYELSQFNSVSLINHSNSIKKVLEGQIIARHYPQECVQLVH